MELSIIRRGPDGIENVRKSSSKTFPLKICRF
jgi:hypothetical protein